jgi:diguanylate cyclase (GGDEF)-like protein/PAS domain S-box-containing protein
MDELLQSEAQAELLQLLPENLDHYVILLLDRHGCLRTWPKAAERLMGFTAKDAIGQSLGWLATESQHDGERLAVALQQAIKARNYHGEFCLRRDTGEPVWAQLTVTAFKPASDEHRRFAVIIQDLSARRQSEQAALATARKRAQVPLQSLAESVVITDAEARIEYTNPVFEQLTGWSGAEAEGRPLKQVLAIEDEDTQTPLECPASRCLREDRAQRGIHCVIRTKGRRYPVETACAPIRAEDGTVTGAVVICHDLSETQQLIDKLEHQATHDSLTGLVNRREFERRLPHTQETGIHGAILRMDLVQFKVVNDTCGHAAGDELLRQLAALYEAHAGESETVARLGGDEFAVLMPRCPIDEAVSVAEKLLAATQNFQFRYQGRQFRVGVGIGVVPLRDRHHSVPEVMRLADHACYLAKANGAKSVYVQRAGDSDIDQRRNEIAWVANLGEYLQQDKLELYHQPIIGITGHSAAKRHCEVLVRLRDTEDRLIGPGRFLPPAERYGLMPELDRWVIRHTLEWMQRNPEALGTFGHCSVNLSAKSLADTTFLSDILAMLEDSRISPVKLCFEITETAAIADLGQAEQFIRR